MTPAGNRSTSKLKTVQPVGISGYAATPISRPGKSKSSTRPADDCGDGVPAASWASASRRSIRDARAIAPAASAESCMRRRRDTVCSAPDGSRPSSCTGLPSTSWADIVDLLASSRSPWAYERIVVHTSIVSIGTDSGIAARFAGNSGKRRRTDALASRPAFRVAASPAGARAGWEGMIAHHSRRRTQVAPDPPTLTG